MYNLPVVQKVQNGPS